jgi:acetyl esterase/lipase
MRLEKPVPEDTSILTRAARAPDEVLSYGPEPEHVADVRYAEPGLELAPAPPRPLVMTFHGGFWRPQYDRLHLGPMTAALAADGWTVANVEYRRIPHHPNYMVGDVEMALETLPTKIKRHDGRVLIMGHSAGGHLVLWAASRRPIPQLHGALALAPAADLQLAYSLNLSNGAAFSFVGEEPSKRPDLDPKQMPSPQISTTIVHGDADDTVPVSLSDSYVSSHPKTRLVKLRGAGHFAVIDPQSDVWPIVVGELERLAGVNAD